MSELRSNLQPTRRAAAVFGGGFGLAALPALAGEPLWTLWLSFCGAFLLALLVDTVRCTPLHRLALAVEVPDKLAIGTTGEIVCLARLPAGTSIQGTLDLGGLLHRVSPVAAVAGGNGGVELALPLRPKRRGRTEIERLWLRYRGPWGLVQRTVRHGLGSELEIVPDLAFVHSEALRLLGFRDARAGAKIERYTGDGTEFEALREFVTGDDPRSIDWKASARHTRLLAREMRAERNHQIYLAVDTGRLMAEPVDGAPLVDHAIHAALLLARIGLRHGDRVGLFSFAERPGVYGAARGGAAAFPALMKLTGALTYSSGETNFTLGLTELSLRLRRRSLLIVLTDFVDAVTAELMVENLLRLAKRHLVLFVAFRDPLLLAQTAGAPERLLDVDRAVVADGLLQERQVVLERLRRAGMAVIDAAPREVGARLVNRYLSIKRRERLG